MNKIRKFDFDQDDDNFLSDGLYQVADTCVVKEFPSIHENMTDEEYQGILDFVKEFPEFWAGSAYATCTMLMFSEEPKKLELKVLGTEFN